MIRHIVMWKFSDNANGKSKDENLEYVNNALYSLFESGKIDGLRSMEIGRDVSGTDMSYDMVLVTVFDDLESLGAYKIHPDHVKISEYVKTAHTARAVIDYEF